MAAFEGTAGLGIHEIRNLCCGQTLVGISVAGSAKWHHVLSPPVLVSTRLVRRSASTEITANGLFRRLPKMSICEVEVAIPVIFGDVGGSGTDVITNGIAHRLVETRHLLGSKA